VASDAFYEAYVEVVPTAKGFERSLNKQLSGPSTSAGGAAGGAAGVGFVGAFGKALPIIGGVLAAAGLGDLFASAIEDGGTYQQAQGAVETVFGKLGADAINAFAEGGADSVGQSMNDILQSSSLLGIFGKAAGLADADLVDFSETLITLGADLSAFANTSPEQAVEALTAGLRGESEPLRAYGVLLDDATLKARAMSLGIYDGNGSLTQQQRILAAYNEILAQTTDQQGTFAAESDTLAGQQARTAAAWENISTQIGTAFLPVAQQLSKWFLNEGIPALQEFAAWLNKPETQEGIDGLGQAIGELLNFLRDLGRGAADAGGLIAGFVGLLNGFSFEEFKNHMMELPGFWGNLFRAAADAGKGVGQVIFNTTQGIKIFADQVQQHLATAVSWFQQLPGRIMGAIAGLGDTLYNAGASIIGRFVAGIRGMIGEVGKAVSGVMNFVAGFFPHSPAKWGPLSGSGWADIAAGGAAIANQFAAGIEQDFSRIRAASSGLMGAAIQQMGPTYVQNPWGPGYMEAQTAAVADSRISQYDAQQSQWDKAGWRNRG
jgi:hypothetical protein